jgi:predicted  nucleic acid-binding Zn-ribbon protein
MFGFRALSDDIEIMKKTRDTKAAKLNAMRNACKKASKDIVVELKTLERQVVRPRAETAAKFAKYEEARLKVDEAVEQVREFKVVLGADNPTTVQAEEVVLSARLGRTHTVWGTFCKLFAAV